ncbi:Major facilitator superfamily domain, general substrate transporter [Metarhizium album ARSEF 1941]|uniref:Major facilitator superfamily domain, general substrate transporter n=1 Tax=Metarhizium album (strain ARSEF 1941) TaxID=1081103 RepID=A0A0B2WQU0_METAS|nr:Major facilitator superfamily domain, general substrate transporter [Metarhizium album ARSEF 1941]KHN96378.1 Major facilitator superfamily domain, general substrate transporter [Metarhizium album ARSEF 1941]
MTQPKVTGATPRFTPISHTSGDTAEAYRSISHVSGHDFHPQTLTETVDEDTSGACHGLSPRRKTVIVAVLSFCALLSPISSTSVLAATPEVAKEYDTTGSIINASNAAYMIFMGLSPVVWGPMSQVFGRRPVILLTAVLFFLLSLATALAPDLVSFFAFRALSAFEGTAFILLGSACLADIYHPTERGTAMGWFLSGTLIGPAMGPFIGGIIVTYSSWRSIFWLQTALAGTSVVGVFFLVPETAQHKKIADLENLPKKERLGAVMHMISPIRVLKLFRYWNQVLVACASSALLWNMYSLLTPIRYVLNPRFRLDSPLLGGLFYLAPGMGYVVGTFMGGRWADRTVKVWIKKRNGVRVPEDRLRSAVPFMGIVMPVCILVYGWTVDKSAGGIAVPVIALFVQGMAQLFSFPSLNTYCLDVMPGQGAEVVAANYFVRYLAGCIGSGVVLPAIEGVGVGWFSTISALLLGLSTIGVMAAIRWGESWRRATDAKLEKHRRRTPQSLKKRIQLRSTA